EFRGPRRAAADWSAATSRSGGGSRWRTASETAAFALSAAAIWRHRWHGREHTVARRRAGPAESLRHPVRSDGLGDEAAVYDAHRVRPQHRHDQWQVPVGDDLQTLARGGPSHTGGLGARNGVIVTKTGLLFIAGGDNKVRAYDEDTGDVLWTG